MKNLLYFAITIALAMAVGYLWWRSRNTPTEQQFHDIAPVLIEPLKGDSTQLYHFRDSSDNPRWSAQVEGNNVQLRSLVLRDYTPRGGITPRAEVSIRGGYQYNGVNSNRWVGLGVERQWGVLTLDIEAGLDPSTGAGHAAATAKVSLFRR